MIIIGLVGSSKAGSECVNKILEFIMSQDIQSVEFVSGGGKGVDTYAKSVCEKLGVNFKEFKPDRFSWEEFKKRNLQIANYCDKVISFALPFGTTANVPKCYHCANAGRDDNHEKTAGCYTGKACGKYEVIII
tara:strand:- start:536 stop:934 length:399 start_codon:yes stop_codon:yes gene_type:complete